MRLATVVLLTCATLSGCVEQTLSIDSTPPGALVYLNDQEVGRTPVTRDFTWYGDYEVHLRLEGYEGLKTHQKITAPAWNWAPLDLLANLLPFKFKDERAYAYTLRPLDPAQDQPQGLLDRASDLRAGLEGSAFTRVPTPRAATQPTTGPTTRPTR
jgi:hypothetical protein